LCNTVATTDLQLLPASDLELTVLASGTVGLWKGITRAQTRDFVEACGSISGRMGQGMVQSAKDYLSCGGVFVEMACMNCNNGVGVCTPLFELPVENEHLMFSSLENNGLERVYDDISSPFQSDKCNFRGVLCLVHRVPDSVLSELQYSRLVSQQYSSL
jgi:hypothetical protein